MDVETFAQIGLGVLLLLGVTALAIVFCGGCNASMDDEYVTDLAADERRERLRHQQAGLRRDAR